MVWSFQEFKVLVLYAILDRKPLYMPRICFHISDMLGVGYINGIIVFGFRIIVAASTVEKERSRRLSTSVVNQVVQEALAFKSPPRTRGGKRGRIYYCTQVLVLCRMHFMFFGWLMHLLHSCWSYSWQATPSQTLDASVNEILIFFLVMNRKHDLLRPGKVQFSTVIRFYMIQC